MQYQDIQRIFEEKLPVARGCFPAIKRKGLRRRTIELTFDDVVSKAQGLNIEHGLQVGEITTSTRQAYRGYALGIYDPSDSGGCMFLFSELIPDKGDVTSYAAYPLETVKSLERKRE